MSASQRYLGGAALLVLAAISAPSAARALEIKSEFKKDPATGRMVGYAETVFPQKPDRVWAVLTEAVHGKLSDRTKVCAGLSAEKAREVTELQLKPEQKLLPVSGELDEKLRNAIESALISPVPRVENGAREERFVFRKISVPIPFTSDRWFLAREVHDAQSGLNRQEYTLRIDGLAGNVKFYQSAWTLKPAAGGATVRVDITSDMGIAVPGFLVSLGGKELETSMKRLALMVEAHPVK
jgi:hypothetical protein